MNRPAPFQGSAKRQSLFLLPYFEAASVEQAGTRWYSIETGSCSYQFPSVTTVLGATADRTGLDSWRAFIGEDKAKQIGRRAAVRGSHMHRAVETYLRGQPVCQNTLPIKTVGCFAGMLPLLDRVDNVHLQESALYSPRFGLAGRVDMVAEFDGVLSVIDFKSVTKMKSVDDIRDYFLQVTAYSMMIEYLTGVKIKNLVILMADETRNSNAFVADRVQFEDELNRRIIAFNGR